jgi:S1-C subfamily serine protease
VPRNVGKKTLERLRTRTNKAMAAVGRFGVGAAVLMALAAVGGVDSTQLAPAPAVASVSLYDEDVVVGLYERTIPAVAEISVSQSGRRFGGSGTGTEFFIEGASTIRVTFTDRAPVDAEVVATRRQDDLALLRVDTDAISDLTPLRFADSDLVKPGQLALALGSPFGFESSISLGIVGGTDRSLRESSGQIMTGLIQTDTALNPGNSGGPLINSDGDVIGVNTAVESASNSSGGVGLAIPTSTTIAFIDSYREPADGTGDVDEPRPAWLGISGLSVDANAAAILGSDTHLGVYIITVTPGSPADEAGLRGSDRRGYDGVRLGGDVITGVGKTQIDDFGNLLDAMNASSPGDSVELTLERDGDTLQLTVELENWPIR